MNFIHNYVNLAIRGISTIEKCGTLQPFKYYNNFTFQTQVKAWIHEKFKVASDESYRDPTNLQSKLQKHQAFEAELSANKGRVDSVCKVS